MSNVKSVERDLSPEKTEAILRGAMQEFLEHGYAGARIDKIVAAAGVSKATVYRRFADKETLFTALIQRMAVRVNFFQQQDFPSSQEEPVVFLKRHATKMLNCVAQNPQDVALFRIVIGESGRFPELGRAFLQNVEKPNLDFITQYFATHPKLQLADPEVAARTFIGTLIHFVITRNLLHGGDIMSIEEDRLIDGLLSLIIHPNQSVRL
ncbi:TetR/AcrR family transcriptional regulator [Nostoc sp. LPT]|uniref:TetR/AcrR family transcriptional regulator n=1 Tax=Nostoc sp. LPT TaxID=2815387 RepID=UPI001E03CFC4|nr:TetR/AcrR family transcriptional regulator [Nostoc sp. LPT]MBN4000558.1 TetR/AcrR family transcriptional regulator [Nostoc sp. LPT]